MPSAINDSSPPLARLSVRILTQEYEDYRKLLAEAAQAVTEPFTGSPWAADRDAYADNEAATFAFGNAVDQFQLLVSHMRDQLDALLLMMRHDRLLLPPAWATSRAIMESVILSCWLMDPHVSSEMRTARAASLHLGEIQGSIDQLNKQGQRHYELIRELLLQRSEAVELYQDNGFIVVLADKPDKPIRAVRFGQSKASINNNVTQLAERYLPDNAYQYGIFSGAVHGQPWLLNGLAADADEAVRSIIGPLISISEVYTESICHHLGLSGDRYVGRRVLRLTALMQDFRTQRPRHRPRATAFGMLETELSEREILEDRRGPA